MLVSNASISFATEDDLEVLGQILFEAQGPEAVMAFFFKDWPAATTMLPFMTARARMKFADPHSKVLKIIDDTTGEILGVTAITLETGEEKPDRDNTSIAGASGAAIPNIDWEFGAQVIVGLQSLDEVMVGEKHYGTFLSIQTFAELILFEVISLLAIRPSYQGRGLGTKLMNFCADIADEARLPTFLTAFPGAHSLYLKLGYEEKTHYDLDLGSYGKKYRGFGIYRSYGMLRQPGTASLENKP
jgi:GNAT superfamily N-acetyltransferase